jgi:hypothetical protein
VSEVFIALDGRPLDEAVRQSFAGLPSSGARRPVTVLLSGALASPFLFGPIAGLRGKREAHAAAKAAAMTACGIGAACLVTLESDPRSAPALVTAVAEATVQSVYDTATELGLKVRSIRPVWAVAIARAGEAAAQATTFACRDADALVLLADDGQRWQHASVYHPAQSDDTVLRALLRRTTMALDLEGVRCVLAEVVSTPTTDGTAPTIRCADFDLEFRP